ncbi:MAG: hypothetical protein ACN4E2_02515 [Nitrospinota bacterium]
MLDKLEAMTSPQKLTTCINELLEKEAPIQESRNYLGASILGVDCLRALQFGYTSTPKDDGRDFNDKILRIFEAGHLFEDLCVNWLRRAGFEIQTEDENGEQLGFSLADGRIQGHVDGIILAAPDNLDLLTPMLWECKSLNHRSWKDTVENGLAKSKPIYAAQIAIYQAHMEILQSPVIQPALFTAVNKNSAELYHELIPFDSKLAQHSIDKANSVLKATDNNELLGATRSNYNCKFCAWQDRCDKEDNGSPTWLDFMNNNRKDPLS